MASLSAVIGAVTMTALAADTNSTDNSTTSTADQNQFINNQQPANMQMGDMQGFGMGRGHMAGFMGGINGVEVSDEFAANVNTILNSDSDVANLISQGYNVTSINPVLKTVIEGDGTLTTKATTATVILQNGDSGYSIVNVDIANAKVTYIETITRTVIDKSGNS